MREQNVDICKGAGCKAWSSDKIARELREIQEGLGLGGVRVCRVKCMGVCGGGASVRVNSQREVLKIEEVDDILGALAVPAEMAEVNG